MTAYNGYGDKKKLLYDIGVIDFAMIDMGLYLDTHPYDQEALDKWSKYQRTKKQLEREYTMKFGPLRMDDTSGECKEWKWGLQDAPWERGYC